MKFRHYLLLELLVVFIMVACESGGGTSGKKATEAVINEGTDREATISYTVHTANTGEKAKVGDYLVLHMKYTNEKDSVIYDSFSRKRPLNYSFNKTLFRGALTPGLSQMAEGDSATFTIPSSAIFGKRLPKFLNEGENLLYTIKLLEVQTKEEYEKENSTTKGKKAETAKPDPNQKKNDTEKIKKYLLENKLSSLSTSTGLHYVIKNMGGTSKPKKGSRVKVHYKGSLLDGTEFDSSYKRNKPFEFVIGEGNVIRGWDEGIAKFGKGGKGKLVIPSDLGYGPLKRTNIPANSVLVFDIEVIDFTQ